MTLLPRTYWCHVDVVPAPRELIQDRTTTNPGEAVQWVREAVRDLSPSLDRKTFHIVWGWLGDHRAVQAAIEDLRRGQPYAFSVTASAGRWTVTAHPVFVLPVVEHDCTYHDRSSTHAVREADVWARNPLRGPLTRLRGDHHRESTSEPGDDLPGATQTDRSGYVRRARPGQHALRHGRSPPE